MRYHLLSVSCADHKCIVGRLNPITVTITEQTLGLLTAATDDILASPLLKLDFDNLQKNLQV